MTALTYQMVGMLESARDLGERGLLIHPEGLSAWPTVKALERRGFLRFESYGSCENGCGGGNDVPMYALTAEGAAALAGAPSFVDMYEQALDRHSRALRRQERKGTRCRPESS